MQICDLKILLATEPSGGGSGRHVIDLAAGLMAMGAHVDLVYSPLRAEKRFEEEVNALSFGSVVKVPMRRAVGPKDMLCAYQFRRLVDDRGGYNIVHAHSSKAGAIARLGVPCGIPVVYTPHAFRTMDPQIGRLSSFFYKRVEWLLSQRRNSAIIAVSADEYGHAISAGIDRNKLSLIPNGLRDVDLLSRDNARRALGIKEEAVVVGFVGRVSPQKNPLRFARAVVSANKQNQRIKGVMLVSGEMEEEAVEGAKGIVAVHRDLDARIYLRAFDMLAITSMYEAMPYIMIEALDAGLPIITTDVGGARATVTPEHNGYILPISAASDAFAQKFIQLSKNQQVLLEFGAASKEASRRFRVKDMVAETAKLYLKLARSAAVH